MAWMLIKRHDRTALSLDGIGGEVTQSGRFTLFTEKTSRFVEDHIFEVSEDKGLILDGVVLNKSELLAAHDGASWTDVVYDLSTPICKYLRGPFTGCVWKGNLLYAFANQTGDTAVFYYKNDVCLVVSSSFSMIHKFCTRNGFVLTYDEAAANHILSLGWVVEGHTLANEIRRIRPGEVLYYDNDALKEDVYYRLDNTYPIAITMEQAVELLDNAFRKAVKRCFDKDLEYEYGCHLADISGGFDSRMVSWVARDLGYSNITNICYAKSDSREPIYARAASLALGNEFLFKPLDDMSFFYDIDDVVRKNFGLTNYIAFTGGNRLLSDISFEKFGLEHTGQLGDVIIGSYMKKGQSIERNPIAICTSRNASPVLEFADNFPNHELFAMYYRGFYGILSSHFIRNEYTYAVSPFIDTDFIDTCMSIPLEYRRDHKLYYAWLAEKYPAVLTVASTRLEKPSWRNAARKLAGKYKKPIFHLLNRLKLYKFASNPNTMNPLDYWYSTNPKLQMFITQYYHENTFRLNAYPSIKQQVEEQFNGIRVSEKLLAITILGGLKNYFGTENE